VIRTWENARTANAFPSWVKQELADPLQSFRLETIDEHHWNLYKISRDGSGKYLWVQLKSDPK